MISKLLMLVVLLLTLGCALPDKPSPQQADDLLQNIAYKRDHFGNCLAIVLSFTHNGHKVFSIASVEKGCEP